MHPQNLTLFVDNIAQKTDAEDPCKPKDSVALAGRVQSEAKSEFLQGRTECCSRVIGGREEYKSQDKRTAVKNAPCPKSVVQLCSLLGFINYFSIFFYFYFYLLFFCVEPFNSPQFSGSTAQGRIASTHPTELGSNRHTEGAKASEFATRLCS